MTQGPGQLAIDSGFTIAITGNSDARLQSAVKRFVARLSQQTGIPILGHGQAVMTIQCQESGPAIPALGEDESYQLDVSLDGAQLTAPAVTGVLRGLETFGQLVSPGSQGFQVPSIHIQDKPRFPWRGLMLDVARHWMPVPVIERNLDAMAAVKLNVFHWHLADDQGFRVESKLRPRLQRFGSDGDFYTQEDVRHIVAYARDRAIRVIPEFDMPGHTTSWLVGYPELASAPGPYQIERSWGIFEPTLDPSRETTYQFLDALIGEMAALFPDPYFHIGGDEVEDAQWKRSAPIQAFAREHGLKDSHELHAYFNRRVQELVKKHAKTMIGWDEVLSPGMSPDTVIQSWRGPESLADAAKQGYRGILSFGYYLDHLDSARFHYCFDPEPAPTHSDRILGGEACMWSEYVNPQTVDSRIWPLAAAIAERLWSPKNVTDVDSMYTRMEVVSRVLDAVGAQHRSNFDRMLDRLAGGHATPALRVLAQACEALGIEGRRDARKYTSLVPLNRFVDAVPPESEAVRALEWAGVPELRLALTGWKENPAMLAPLAKANFFVTELMPLSENLSTLGAIGLEILDYMQKHQRAPEGWLHDKMQLLDNIEQQPKAEVRLAAARTIRRMLEAELKKSKTFGPVTNGSITGRQPF